MSWLKFIFYIEFRKKSNFEISSKKDKLIIKDNISNTFEDGERLIGNNYKSKSNTLNKK